MEEKWEYMHDGGPTKATVTMESAVMGNYQINLYFSDPTDYERYKIMLRMQFDALSGVKNSFPRG
jgi:hypothetical protein